MRQRQLLATAGWPDCRKVYEENLEDAKGTAAYYEKLLAFPYLRGQGTGSSEAEICASLERAKAKVAYREQLIVELDRYGRDDDPHLAAAIAEEKEEVAEEA